jgi:hypothetical protein
LEDLKNKNHSTGCKSDPNPRAYKAGRVEGGDDGRADTLEQEVLPHHVQGAEIENLFDFYPIPTGTLRYRIHC